MRGENGKQIQLVMKDIYRWTTNTWAIHITNEPQIQVLSAYHGSMESVGATLWIAHKTIYGINIWRILATAFGNIDTQNNIWNKRQYDIGIILPVFLFTWIIWNYDLTTWIPG